MNLEKKKMEPINFQKKYEQGFEASVVAVLDLEKEDNDKKVKEMEVIVSLHQQLLDKMPKSN